MNLITVNVESVQIGHPLPFALRSEDGRLLAQKGFVVRSRRDLHDMVGRGFELYVDVTESENHRRAYVGKLHKLVRQEKPLGEIAGARISAADLNAPQTASDEPPEWLDLQVQANAVLHDHNPDHFLARFEKVHHHLQQHALHNPDGALFALIYLSATEPRMYSATQAMLVSVMCGLAAREVLNWSPDQQAILSKAALSMNVGMTELQDRLALQLEPPTVEQRALLSSHPQASATLLQQMGVTDAYWLEAVRTHHNKTPGPLQGRTPTGQMARLIQRADLFAASLAPRASRLPVSPAAAMQVSLFDENKAMDEAGAALIRTMGVYAPGSFVRLASEEIAVVVRRGANAAMPKVAVLVNREGMPTMESSTRDTSQPNYRIVTSVSQREVKIQINLERLMPLTLPTASDRPW
jgi:HD-GYP domain-containing protein (c-di-GMP phosphodiesterase class II)